MHDWLKKNQKKLLAVLGAFLMVSFLVTVPLGSLTSKEGGKGAQIGKFGKTVFYDNDRRRAAALWKLLEGSYSVALLKEREQMDQIAKEDKDIIDKYGKEIGEMILRGQRNQGRPVPQLIDVRAVVLLDPARPRLITTEMKDHPELFLLLVKEAEQRGIFISTDRLREAMKNEILPDPETLGKDVDSNLYEEAVRDFLKIQALRDLVLNDAKYSGPKWDQFFTEICRVERLNRVEYSADVAALKTPPTTQQVQTQYDDFKNVDPEDPNKPATDPLGFGYFQPNRVKVQYLTVSRKDVLSYFVKRVNDISEPPVLKIWLLSQARSWFWLFNADLPLQKKAWDEYNGNKENYGIEYTAQQLEQKSSQIEEQAQQVHRQNVLGTNSTVAETNAKAAESDAGRAARDAQDAQRSARAARDPQTEESARMKSLVDAMTKIQSAKEAIETAGKELAQAQIEAAKPATTQPFGPVPLPATTKPATAPTTKPASAHPTTAPSSSVDVPPPCGDPTILAFATEPATSPAAVSPAATQPATNPAATAPSIVATPVPATTQSVSLDEDEKIFEQLSDEIVSVGLKSEIDKMEADIASAIRGKMLDDWHAWLALNPQTATATDLPYTSPEYLPDVAKFIQAQYKILPQFTQRPDWLTARQAKELPGIGASVALETDLYGEWPFFKIGLAVLKPSQVINDDAGDVHVFRFTDVSPAHPKDLNEVTYPIVAWNFAWGTPIHPVLAKVVEDTKLKLAYDDAKAKAERLVQRVKSGESLTKAAKADAKEPTLTDYFNRDTASQHHISFEVAAEAEKLLAKASDKDPNPISVIEMPASREVLVVQLDHVMIQAPEQFRSRGMTIDDLRFREKLRRSEMEEARTGNTLAESFFTFDAVSKRMGYQPEATSKSGS